MPLNLETLYSALFAKYQCTVQYIRKHVHGLSFVPQTSEHVQPQHPVSPVVKALYNKYKTDTKKLVAFKGGHAEKDLLTKLNILWTDLEKKGLPQIQKKYI